MWHSITALKDLTSNINSIQKKNNILNLNN